MTVQKLTYPAKENAVQEKVNEIIDNLGGGGGSYTAGTGIDISNNTISVDNTVAMKTDIPAPVTETTVSGWGFTKNVGTVTSVNNTQPVNGNVTLSIPAAQVNSDWNANSGVAQILNKPTLGTMAAESAGDYTPTSGLATVATTGAYSDLSGKPTIPTVNNATLTITQGGTTKGTFTANASSNVTIDLDSGGGGDVDNSTITLNSSNKMQAVAVKDTRSGNAVKTWTGTKAQYDAIVSKDSNTLYNITDDTDVKLTVLEALYPVGSTYTTTASTCPLVNLISGSTWVEETCRVLVEKSVSGTEWYNLYSDGWCEQGGVSQSAGDQTTNTIGLLKNYTDTNYSILFAQNAGVEGSYTNGCTTKNKTTSSFALVYRTGGTASFYWYACGYTSTTTSHKRFRRTA